MQSLTIAQHSVSNKLIKEQIVKVVTDVDKGCSLSNALASISQPFFPLDFVAMVKIGEESGNLRPMIVQCAKLYEERVAKALDLFASLVQPGLMIFLGLMIAFLIVGVYMPVFELSNAVSWA